MTTLAVKERPILFSATMILALLEGRKTQTRRIIKNDWWRCLDPEDDEDRADAISQCPYGQLGDRLWVKERHWRHEQLVGGLAVGSGPGEGWRKDEQVAFGLCAPGIDSSRAYITERWKICPSIHLPRKLSRITLEITDVRIQRVRDISDEDAIAEGFAPSRGRIGWQPARDAFLDLFFNINKRAPSDSNPWVWALTFKRVKP